MVELDFGAIEAKWQKKWEEGKVFGVSEDSDKDKFYVLEMFPYPSGAGLHMGHALNYTIGDILARFKIMKGFNVLHPMGFDALGLPAENAAIKAGTHPEEYTNKAIENFIRQQKALGVTYDWSRMVNTASPEYYKWDQWIFLKMLERGLAYQKEASVNWCPKCNTVLANEQVEDGKCWRHEDTEVMVRKLKQWFFKTTEYAEELLSGLEDIDWPERTKKMQENWIGRSEGAEILFEVETPSHEGCTLESEKTKWKVFTTRPDTIFGVTFMVVAAGHERLMDLVTSDQEEKVDEYLKRMHSVSEKDIERNEKEGVFTGSYAINPANGEKVPIWAGNFVLADYGSGMVMGVPAHDKRDFDFAKKYGIEVRQVVAPFICKNVEGNKETKERCTVFGIVKNPKDGKILCLDWKKIGWKAFPAGGVDDGEDIIDAVRREILEETGYKNLKFIRKIGGELYQNFYRPHKGNNVYCKNEAYLFELVDDDRNEVDASETEKHEAVWIDEDEVKDFVNVFGPQVVWDWYLEGDSAYVGEGILCNSGKFDRMSNVEAKERIVEWLGEKAGKVVNFKLRDWGVSRQRYWGTPIPVVYCDECGCVPVPESELPVELPKDVKFGEGNPLETAKDWIKTSCPKCGGDAQRESDTMDTFVNSSWYFLRYADPNNSEKIFDKDKVVYWNPVDVYIGGAEHACMHLLYARFYTKFLRDIGVLDFDEPFSKLFHQGMLHAEDGRKMSKSLGNVVEPIETMDKYGVDATRWFLVSVASPDKNFDWSEKGISGATRFLKKVWAFYDRGEWSEDSDELLRKLNLTLKNLENYYGGFDYRKATIELRELFKLMESGCSLKSAKKFVQMISPIAPHLGEELWNKISEAGFVSRSSWPEIDEGKILKRDRSGEDLNAKIAERVKGIMKDDAKKVYVYVMPFELEKVNAGKISDEVGKEVLVFAVNDEGKIDPEGRAKKAKPGLCAVWFE